MYDILFVLIRLNLRVFQLDSWVLFKISFLVYEWFCQRKSFHLFYVGFMGFS